MNLCRLGVLLVALFVLRASAGSDDVLLEGSVEVQGETVSYLISSSDCVNLEVTVTADEFEDTVEVNIEPFIGDAGFAELLCYALPGDTGDPTNIELCLMVGEVAHSITHPSNLGMCLHGLVVQRFPGLYDMESVRTLVLDDDAIFKCFEAPDCDLHSCDPQGYDQCSLNGECNPITEFCDCNWGYYGTDCSYEKNGNCISTSDAPDPLCVDLYRVECSSSLIIRASHESGQAVMAEWMLTPLDVMTVLDSWDSLCFASPFYEGCELCIVIEDVELSAEDNYVCFKVRLSCSGDRFEAEEIQMLCPIVDIDEYPCENEEEMCELSTVLRPKLLPYEVVIPEQLPVSFFVPLVGPTVDIVLSLEHPISSAVASVFFSYDCPLVTEDDLDGANSVLLTPSLPRYISLCSDCEGELTGLTENPEHARGVFVYARCALDQPCGRLQLDPRDIETVELDYHEDLVSSDAHDHFYYRIAQPTPQTRIFVSIVNGTGNFHLLASWDHLVSYDQVIHGDISDDVVRVDGENSPLVLSLPVLQASAELFITVMRGDRSLGSHDHLVLSITELEMMLSPPSAPPVAPSFSSAPDPPVPATPHVPDPPSTGPPLPSTPIPDPPLPSAPIPDPPVPSSPESMPPKPSPDPPKPVSPMKDTPTPNVPMSTPPVIITVPSFSVPTFLETEEQDDALLLGLSLNEWLVLGGGVLLLMVTIVIVSAGWMFVRFLRGRNSSSTYQSANFTLDSLELDGDDDGFSL